MFNTKNTEHLINTDDKYESLYSAIFLEKSKEEILDIIFNLLKKSKNIKNKFKKAKINDALYNFKLYVEEKLNDETNYENVFFFSNDIVEKYELSKKQKNVIKEF